MAVISVSFMSCFHTTAFFLRSEQFLIYRVLPYQIVIRLIQWEYRRQSNKCVVLLKGWVDSIFWYKYAGCITRLIVSLGSVFDSELFSFHSRLRPPTATSSEFLNPRMSLLKEANLYVSLFVFSFDFFWRARIFFQYFNYQWVETQCFTVKEQVNAVLWNMDGKVFEIILNVQFDRVATSFISRIANDSRHWWRIVSVST